jgi:hypothetical protein
LRSLRQKINRKGPYSTIELLSEFAKLYPAADHCLLAAGLWSIAPGHWFCQPQKAGNQSNIVGLATVPADEGSHGGLPYFQCSVSRYQVSEGKNQTPKNFSLFEYRIPLMAGSKVKNFE